MRRIEFIVHAVRTDGGLCYVAGRSCGDTLRIGDTFQRWRGNGSSEDASLSLCVESIRLYGRYLNQIESGMTAELALRTRDVPSIELGTILGEAELPLFETSEIVDGPSRGAS
jgi:hypothetical protein